MMFKFSFSDEHYYLILISFGDARKRRKSPCFDSFDGKFQQTTPKDDTGYWFWSDEPPKKVKDDIIERELSSV